MTPQNKEQSQGTEKSVADPATDDKVLSDDEVNALLGEVASGEVEICTSTGPQFAVVEKFNVPQRSRILRNRLPNLDISFERLAERLRAQTQRTLKWSVEVTSRDAAEMNYEAIKERRIEPVVAVQFSAAPLPGHGAILIEWELINQIVEGYFGGTPGESAIEYSSGFTYGEMRVASNFCELVLAALKDVWQPMQIIEPVITKMEQSAHLLDFAADNDSVVRCGFDFCFAEKDTAMHVLLPSEMIAAFLPYLKGIDREEDASKDLLWSKSIRDNLKDIDVNVAATVGDVTMTLGDLICLLPGDVISIANPRAATLSACGVPLVAAHFGVLAGRNAVEAKSWLNDE